MYIARHTAYILLSIMSHRLRRNSSGSFQMAYSIRRHCEHKTHCVFCERRKGNIQPTTLARWSCCCCCRFWVLFNWASHTQTHTKHNVLLLLFVKGTCSTTTTMFLTTIRRYTERSDHSTLHSRAKRVVWGWRGNGCKCWSTSVTRGNKCERARNRFVSEWIWCNINNDPKNRCY